MNRGNVLTTRIPDIDELAWGLTMRLEEEDVFLQKDTRPWTAFEDIRSALATRGKHEPNDRLWEVRCKVHISIITTHSPLTQLKHGEEDKIVYRIMRRALHPTMPVRRAKNVFSNPNIGARIFIEAANEEDVLATIQGVSGTYAKCVQSLPQALYSRLLRVYGKPAPEEDDWIVLRKSKDIPQAYDGAYAWIFEKVQSAESEGLFHVIAAPRLETLRLQTTRLGGSNPDDGEFIPPFQVVDVVREVIPSVYTLAEMEEVEKHGVVLASFALEKGPWKIIKHKGECRTSDGFICFWGISRSSFIHSQDITPDRATIDRFCHARFLSDSGTQLLLRTHQQRTMKLGSRVSIDEGAYRSKVGVIKALEDPMAFITIESLEVTVEVALQSLRLDFQVADTVKVIDGDYLEHWGWVTDMDADSVELYVQDLSTAVILPMTSRFRMIDHFPRFE